MRILLLTKNLAEVADEERLIHEISNLGVRMSVVVPAGRWRGPANAAEKLQPRGYELMIRGCPFTWLKSVTIRTHVYYYRGISEVIGRENWDLVHVDEEGCNLATYHVVRACHRRRRKVVFTSRKNIFRNYPLPFNLFERYVYRNADGALVGNADALGVLRSKGFRKCATVVQFGVDPGQFRRLDTTDLRRRFELGDGFVVGYLGRLLPIKGLDSLIKAFALLPKGSTLVMVGDGPEGPRLKALAESLGVSARVRWQPWVEHKEVSRYMSLFDVYVLPSLTLQRCSEHVARVLIETMACETAVVGSDSGDTPEVIGDAGLVFHEGDEKQLAEQLLRLLKDQSLCKELGRRGRERVLEHFTYEKIAKRTVDFYQEICSTRPTS
jgi:glycosyltransferase involved in cell wall biosynthesis